ncbi:hypothetical protein E0H22_00640 [Rhodopseudomonas boonkerdii]|uniref:hypothetical protein n=1 Tax=Rhodopseudomonas boonkerdii TaxID=475937 RepID=UPI001E4907B8|nr:hypothetical protein [Rhodopseudomonas boonkerdii]UGV24319.1 hypothetical protein E0H22_00640 [Rhodopseudomonas boonkerdii]
MTLKFSAAKLTGALLAAAAVITIGVATPAEAQTKRKQVTVDNGRFNYGPRGPNVSYQQGPRTRVYISRRSWLDAGTEVLPGDRKFTDYAYPPGQSFARGNLNRPLDRQPLYSDWDLGGYPNRIPLPY